MQENNLEKLELLLKEEFLASNTEKSDKNEDVVFGLDIAEIMEMATNILNKGGFYIYKENISDLAPKKLENHKLCMVVASFNIPKGSSLVEFQTNKLAALEDTLEEDTNFVFSAKEDSKESTKLLYFYQKL